MILVDSNFLIDLLRGNRDFSVFREKVTDETYSISLLTLSELYSGVYYMGHKYGKTYLTKLINPLKSLLTHFIILNLNEDIMELAGEMSGKLKSEGRVIELMDLIIGATATYYNAKYIVTNNKKHFECWNIPFIEC